MFVNFEHVAWPQLTEASTARLVLPVPLLEWRRFRRQTMQVRGLKSSAALHPNHIWLVLRLVQETASCSKQEWAHSRRAWLPERTRPPAHAATTSEMAVAHDTKLHRISSFHTQSTKTVPTFRILYFSHAVVEV